MGTDPFIYREKEQELRCEESDEHPKHLEEKATSWMVAPGWNVQVKSAPYAYDQCTEAKRDDPERAPLLWFSHPQICGVARGSGIGCRILHLFGGSIKTTDPAE